VEYARVRPWRAGGTRHRCDVPSQGILRAGRRRAPDGYGPGTRTGGAGHQCPVSPSGQQQNRASSSAVLLLHEIWRAHTRLG
jgi:hypothetical protein